MLDKDTSVKVCVCVCVCVRVRACVRVCVCGLYIVSFIPKLKSLFGYICYKCKCVCDLYIVSFYTLIKVTVINYILKLHNIIIFLSHSVYDGTYFNIVQFGRTNLLYILIGGVIDNL